MAMDYKAKYQELRNKLIESTDVAYRLGYADGLKQGGQDAMQQQQQMMMQPQIDPQTGQPIPPQPGMPGQMGGMSGQPPMPGQPGAGDGQPMSPEQQMAAAQMGGAPGMEEGDGQPSSEIDQYIQELEGLVSKGEKPSLIDLRKKVEGLATLRKAQKMKVKQNTVQVASAQKKMVNDILKKWETESKQTSDNLEDLIKEQGLKLN